MTMSSAPALTFRTRRFPAWLCFGVSAVLLLMWLTVSVSLRDVGLGVVLFLLVGAPALLIFKMANDLRRSRIVIGEEGLDLRVGRFRLWAFRSVGSARLRWSEVHGVQVYEIPNFAAPGGTQVDYVLHTTQGTFAVSSMQFPDARRIAALIAERVGRPVGELPAGTAPASANTPAGRRGVRLMRALGWVSQGAGILFLVLMTVAWLGGSPLPPSTIGGVATASGILLMLGRALRRFSLK